MTIADLRRCRELPNWLVPLIAHRPDNERISKLHDLLCRYQDSPKGTGFDSMIGVASSLSLPFWLVAGSRLGPWGVAAGAFAGLAHATEFRKHWSEWQARKRKPGGLSDFEEWLEQMGAPWTEPLPEGGTIDRRFPSSPFLSMRESRLDPEGNPLSHAFLFHRTNFHCDLVNKKVRVTNAAGQSCQFDARLDDLSGFDLRLDLNPEQALMLYASGKALLQKVEAIDPYDLNWWERPPRGIDLRPEPPNLDFPFPLQWLQTA